MNLIIIASLSEPPTESLSFRYLTLSAHLNLTLDCLIETEQEMKDSYYHFMARKGLLDFVEQLIIPTEGESGIRLDTDSNLPKTIKTKSITCENYSNLLKQIANFL